jgi:hypothetical protein
LQPGFVLAQADRLTVVIVCRVSNPVFHKSSSAALSIISRAVWEWLK